MLVLSRRKSEQIRIGDEIIIKVIDVKGGTVRIGIDAPAEIPIIRSELLPEMVPGRQSGERKPADRQEPPSDDEGEAASDPASDTTLTNHGSHR